MQRAAWTRLTVVAGLFLLGIAVALFDWRRHPPVAGLTGTATYMRNVPGDLTMVLRLYLIEAFVAIAALQPWREKPRRRWIGIAALGFAMWGALRWLIGLHSPTVMFGHDVLVLVIALGLACSILVFAPPSSPGDDRAPIT